MTLYFPVELELFIINKYFVNVIYFLVLKLIYRDKLYLRFFATASAAICYLNRLFL